MMRPCHARSFCRFLPPACRAWVLNIVPKNWENHQNVGIVELKFFAELLQLNLHRKVVPAGSVCDRQSWIDL
eukprot:1377887-Amphidinium_carterae.1